MASMKLVAPKAQFSQHQGYKYQGNVNVPSSRELPLAQIAGGLAKS